jgi:hypothetical protein
MKKYKLIILHSGMNRYRDTIYANGYIMNDGAYKFFVNENPGNGGVMQQRITCLFPINLTIIESIE